MNLAQTQKLFIDGKQYLCHWYDCGAVLRLVVYDNETIIGQREMRIDTEITDKLSEYFVKRMVLRNEERKQYSLGR